MDEEGFLTWHGRLKLMLKVGGENVSLEEVERIVENHEAVLQCGAAGVADKRKTEAVAVYVVRVQGENLSAEGLRGWLKTKLAGFKMPREIVFVDELPRLGSGKLDRRAAASAYRNARRFRRCAGRAAHIGTDRRTFGPGSH